MAGNDITKQLQISFVPENLRPQSTEQGLIDVADRSQRDSTYQSALKKSLDVENRRGADRRPEPDSRKPEPAEATPSRAEEARVSKRDRHQDDSPEPTRNSRPEPERRSRRTESTTPEPAAERSTPARQDTSSTSVDATSQAQTPTAHGQSAAETNQQSPQAEDTLLNNAEVADPTIDTKLETSGDISESLAALNALVAQLLDKSSTDKPLAKPPASFSKDVLNRIGGAETVAATGLAQNPVFETDGDGKLSVPGKLILGLIARQVGQNSPGAENGTPIEPEAIATAIKEAVSELITPSASDGEEAPTDDLTENAKQEILAQIAKSFGKQDDDEEETETTSETNVAPVETTNQAEVPVETPVIPLEQELEQQLLQHGKPVEAGGSAQGDTPANADANPRFEVSAGVNAAPPIEGEETNTSGLEVTKTESEKPLEPNANVEQTAQSELQVTTSSVQTESSTSQSETTPPATTVVAPVTDSSGSNKRDSAKTDNTRTTEDQPVSEATRPRPVITGKEKLAVPVTHGAEVAAATKSTEPVVTTKVEGTAAVTGVEAAGARPVVNDRAATRQASPVTTLPAADSAEFLERLSDSVRVADKNHQQLKVRLTPPQLGSMQIEVTRQDGVVTARMEVQSVAAQQLLLDQMSGLKETLQQQGHHVERIEVTIQEPSRSEQSNQQQSQQDDDGDSRQQQSRQDRQRQQEQQQRQDADEPESESRQPVRAGWSMDNIDVEI